MLCTVGANASPLDVTLLNESRYLGPKLEIWEDFADTSSFPSVRAKDPAEFNQILSQIPVLPYTESPVWVRIGLFSKQSKEVFLEVATPLMDEVTVFVADTTGNVQTYTTGLRVPTIERPFMHWNYVFPVYIPAGQTLTVVMKLRNEGSLDLALRAWNEKAFYQYNHRSMVVVGFFYGLLVGVSLLVFLSFQTFQDRIYLYYLATIVSFFLFLSCKNGIGLRFLVPEWMGTFLPFISVLSTQLLLLSVLQFSRTFLNTRLVLPRVDRLMRMVGWLIALSLFLCVILNPVTISAILPYLTLLVLGVVLMAVVRRKNHDRQTFYFILGMAVPVALGFMYTLQFVLPFPDRIVNIEDFYWGFLFLVVFIGFGLGKRLHSLQQETMLLQRQSVENLQKADQLKDEFLASTSHELRTPLNGIIGITESMLGSGRSQLPVKAQRSMKLIITCGHRLLNLINDILDYSLLKNGEIKLNMRPVQLRQVASIVFSILSPVARKKGLQLINAVGAECPLVQADEDRLQQILLNLVGNAIKFTDQGSVKLTAKIKDHQLIACLEDTGIGISPESHERIFEMFHQVNSSDTRSQGGTGIGLSLSRKLVNLMSGKIWVESEFGSGSRFFFTLPLASHSATGYSSLDDTMVALDHDLQVDLESFPNAPPDASDLPVILLVDDEPINLQVLVNQLSIEGYLLKVASNGEEALELIRTEGPPSMLLLDLMMPGMSGFEVCIQLRAEYNASTLPIIILTAKNQMQDLVKGLEIGANDFLTKPFTRPELLARVRGQLTLQKFHQAYSRFVPQEFLKQMQRENLLEVQMGDQLEQYLAVLVADIRDFTSLSERVSPEETFAFLNDYFQQIAPIIRENGGFVSKFLGDAIIALFPEGAICAYDASKDMLAQLDRLNQTRIAEPVRIGVGIHVGKAVLGTVGYQSRMDVAMVSPRLGQTIMLERLTKIFGCRTILSGDVVRLVKERATAVRLLGRIAQAGREQWLEFYEDSPGNLKLASKGQFEAGVRLFWDGDYMGAKDSFEHVLELNPADSAAQVYLTKCIAREAIDFSSFELG